MKHGRLLSVLVVSVAWSLSAMTLPSVGQEGPPKYRVRKLKTGRRSVPIPSAKASGISAFGAAQQGLANGQLPALITQVERSRCRTSGDPKVSVDMSCNTRRFRQDWASDNEIAIAVDPEDPNHLLAGSNDGYLFPFNRPSLSVFPLFSPLGFFTSFDGGKHWIDGQIPLAHGNFSFDPSPAFDAKHDVALMAGLERRAPRNKPRRGASIVVSRSSDGGRTWREPIIVMRGQGSVVDPRGVDFDKEWLTVDNNPDSPFYGRAYLSATRFFGVATSGFPRESPIFLSYSDDGGRTWSRPKEISGSHPTCIFQETGAPNQCDEDQDSIPEVAADGTLYVHYANLQDEAEWEVPFDFDSQVLVVKSTNGGKTFNKPVPAVQLEDGFSDMPANVDGRNTIWGHQFRWWPYGTITANPKDESELTIVFADRESPNLNAPQGCALRLPKPPRYDPCRAGPGFDTDVFIVRTRDGGETWSDRKLIDGSLAPQWFPWADYTPEGELAIAWDEDTEPAPADHFNHVLWTSDGRKEVLFPPTDEDRTRTENPDVDVDFWVADDETIRKQEWPRICGPEGYSDPPIQNAEGKDCSVFMGDYTGLAVGSDGSINVVWTGMNRFVSSNEIDQYTGELHDGYAQDAMFARR